MSVPQEQLDDYLNLWQGDELKSIGNESIFSDQPRPPKQQNSNEQDLGRQRLQQQRQHQQEPSSFDKNLHGGRGLDSLSLKYAALAEKHVDTNAISGSNLQDADPHLDMLLLYGTPGGNPDDQQFQEHQNWSQLSPPYSASSPDNPSTPGDDNVLSEEDIMEAISAASPQSVGSQQSQPSDLGMNDTKFEDDLMPNYKLLDNLQEMPGYEHWTSSSDDDSLLLAPSKDVPKSDNFASFVPYRNVKRKQSSIANNSILPLPSACAMNQPAIKPTYAIDRTISGADGAIVQQNKTKSTSSKRKRKAPEQDNVKVVTGGNPHSGEPATKKHTNSVKRREATLLPRRFDAPVSDESKVARGAARELAIKLLIEDPFYKVQEGRHGKLRRSNFCGGTTKAAGTSHCHFYRSDEPKNPMFTIKWSHQSRKYQSFCRTGLEYGSHPAAQALRREIIAETVLTDELSSLSIYSFIRDSMIRIMGASNERNTADLTDDQLMQFGRSAASEVNQQLIDALSHFQHPVAATAPPREGCIEVRTRKLPRNVPHLVQAQTGFGLLPKVLTGCLFKPPALLIPNHSLQIDWKSTKAVLNEADGIDRQLELSWFIEEIDGEEATLDRRDHSMLVQKIDLVSAGDQLLQNTFIEAKAIQFALKNPTKKPKIKRMRVKSLENDKRGELVDSTEKNFVWYQTSAILSIVCMILFILPQASSWFCSNTTIEESALCSASASLSILIHSSYSQGCMKCPSSCNLGICIFDCLGVCQGADCSHLQGVSCSCNCIEQWFIGSDLKSTGPDAKGVAQVANKASIPKSIDGIAESDSHSLKIDRMDVRESEQSGQSSNAKNDDTSNTFNVDEVLLSIMLVILASTIFAWKTLPALIKHDEIPDTSESLAEKSSGNQVSRNVSPVESIATFRPADWTTAGSIRKLMQDHRKSHSPSRAHTPVKSMSPKAASPPGWTPPIAQRTGSGRHRDSNNSARLDLFEEVAHTDNTVSRRGVLQIEKLAGRPQNESSNTVSVIAKMLKGRATDLDRRVLEEEAALMAQVEHPFILGHFGTLATDSNFTILMHYTSGTLFETVALLNRPIVQTVKHCLDLCSAMEFIASKGLVHRDLICRNVLLDENMNIKLGGFAQCRELDRTSGKYMLPANCTVDPKISAPETLLENEYSEKTDVYSFGLLICELFGDGILFPGLEWTDVACRVTSGYQHPAPLRCPDLLRKVIVQPCLSLMPGNRPSFASVRMELETSQNLSDTDLQCSNLEARLVQQANLPMCVSSRSSATDRFTNDEDFDQYLLWLLQAKSVKLEVTADLQNARSEGRDRVRAVVLKHAKALNRFATAFLSSDRTRNSSLSSNREFVTILEVNDLLVSREDLVIDMRDIEFKSAENFMGGDQYCLKYRGRWSDVKEKKDFETELADHILVRKLERRNHTFNADELSGLASLKHRCISKFHGICKDQSTIYALNEFNNGGTIHEFFQLRPSKIDNDLVVQWSLDLAEGLNYYHDYRPLDVNFADIEIGDRHIKFSDLSTETLTESTGLMLNHVIVRYYSPEKVRSGEFDHYKNDVYGFGIVMWKILKGVTPYMGLSNHHVSQMLASDVVEPLPIPYGTDPDLRQLLQSCLATNPIERPTLRNIIASLKAMQRPMSTGDFHEPSEGHGIKITGIPELIIVREHPVDDLPVIRSAIGKEALSDTVQSYRTVLIIVTLMFVSMLYFYNDYE